MLKLQNLTITRGPRTLIKNINLNLYEKYRVGVIGANGCGKSTLFSVIKGEWESSAGHVEINKHLRVQFLAQETPGLDISAVHYTLSGDERLYRIVQELDQAEKAEDYTTVAHCHHRLGEIDGYSAEARAAKVLIGLGFKQSELSLPVKNFSGGWRMRLNLAKCLFAPSDILLLDEPTNHLDMEAIIWLEHFIQHYQGAILMVSHDRDFLDHTVTHIAHIENQELKLYTGNYSTFETERANALALQHAQYQKQQAKISHAMDFVNRFRAKATKARQAQSRLRAIEKMELIKPVYEKSPFHFSFLQPDALPNPMVVMHSVNLGYQEKTVLYRINLSITCGQRIGLLGLNGQGKSTLIKGICGVISPLKGHIEKFPGTKIGYFAQHQVDFLPLTLSPLSILQEMGTTQPERELLAYFGSFNFSREQSLAPMSKLSGGEKARIALALIIWQRPNLLLLDEPTNHLDMEVRQALVFALQAYQGAVILVSHDRYLMRTLVDELLLIKDGRVNRFDGTVEDYEADY